MYHNRGDVPPVTGTNVSRKCAPARASVLPLTGLVSPFANSTRPLHAHSGGFHALDLVCSPATPTPTPPHPHPFSQMPESHLPARHPRPVRIRTPHRSTDLCRGQMAAASTAKSALHTACVGTRK